MVAGIEGRGPLWVDGRFTVRVRGAGPGRVIRLRRPFALVGRLPGADIPIDDPAVEDRHAFLLLDRVGLFGVDLLTRSGTRFAGTSTASARLGLGDVLEVAGRRIEILQIRVDDGPDGPLPPGVDPLAEADPSRLVALTLESLDDPGPAWMLGSSLAFAGSGEACAIRVGTASPTHCALLRGPSTAHVIDLLGGPTRLNERDVQGASPLADGDVLAMGEARFAVRVSAPRPADGLGAQPRFEGAFGSVPGLPDDLAGTPRAALLALMMTGAARPAGEAQGEVLRALRVFQADAATLFEAQIERIEALGREIVAIRERLDALSSGATPEAPPEPLRLDQVAREPSAAGESPDWLLDRLSGLESESRSTWKDLIARIAASVRLPGARS